MPHDYPLISTLAYAFGFAIVLGLICVKLKLPALVGYLLAGIAVGPYTPGITADIKLAEQLAEIGVMLLMFGVGLHFSLRELYAVRKIAVPGAIVQIGAATLMGMAASWLWGWSWGAGLVFGLSLSVASTVVLLKALENFGLLNTPEGNIAVGWLIVEDLAMVLALVLLPPLARLMHGQAEESVDSVGAVLFVTFSKIGLFALLMMALGRKIFPWLLWQIGRTKSRELFTLGVIALAIGITYFASKIFGVSFALGAFIAGMVIRESSLSKRAEKETLPLRDAFAVLFFVSVGMLFNPNILIDKPSSVLAVLLIILVGKTVAAFLIVLAFRYPLKTAVTVSASLAQIGEFSFILAGLGVALAVLPTEGQQLIVAGAILSMAINPFLFRFNDDIREWLCKRFSWINAVDKRQDELAVLPDSYPADKVSGHVIIIGYGRVGRRVANQLRQDNIKIAVVDSLRETVHDLRDDNVAAICGDACAPSILIQAHVVRASVLVLAIPEVVAAKQIIDIALTLNPQIRVIARTHSEGSAKDLVRAGAHQAFVSENELANILSANAKAQMAQRPTPEE